METDVKIEKIASIVSNIDSAITSDKVLTKLAFSIEALKKNRNTTEERIIKKEAAPTLGSTMGRALVAGLGLGLAGEVLDYTQEKGKEMLFKKNMSHLIKQIKKQTPELKNTDDKKIKTMLEAGYTVAPDVMENPTVAASFVSIGNSLGGKVDPNTLKLFAEVQNKRTNGINRLSDTLNPGLGIGANV